jgi:hypothetical protein
MDRIRRPPLIAAGVLMALVVIVEIGAAAFIGSGSGDQAEMDAICASEGLDPVAAPQSAADGPPGLGIPFLALIDVFLLRYLLLAVASLTFSNKNLGRIQGIATLVLSLVVLIVGIILLFISVAMLMLKISLLLAVPFGTLAYLALFGFFAKPAAASVLGFLFLLKIAGGVLMVLAQQRFLKSKSLVLLFLTSLLGGVIVSFLHGIVPVFLVSITDNIAALVVLVLGIIWAVNNLVGSIIAVVKIVT